MQLGMIGLGRMGANLARRLLRHGHACVVYDRDPAPGRQLAQEGATAVTDLAALVTALAPPRHVWLMLPAGDATEATLEQLAGLLDAGDVLIDGGNGFYRDDLRRARQLAASGLHYLDVGTSGGVAGLERGYCLMIGGDAAVVERLDPVFSALAPGSGALPRTPGRDRGDPRAERGYLHAGTHGAGHFLKMVHNGIEYGLMQAYAEGFDILRQADALPDAPGFAFALDDVAEVWRRGSVISSWLLDLVAAALASDVRLEQFQGPVQDSGEGRWTLHTAIEQGVPAPVLSAALQARFRSRQQDCYADRLLSAMRKGFGGHREPGAQ